MQAVVERLTDARLITTEGAEARQKDSFVEVAHEALIRNWSQLRMWVDADRFGLRTHRRLTEAAQEWDANGRDLSYLYVGTRLAIAKEWADTRPKGLSTLESEFLAASLEADKLRRTSETAGLESRHRRNRRLTIGSVMALSALVTWLTVGLRFESKSAS